jgi:Ribbon-helix-helix protein, copG family
MIRTQVSLEKEAYEAAKAEAERTGISLAEFFRRSVAAALGECSRRKRPWLRHAGVLNSGDSSASGTVDQVVYRRPRP